MDSNRRRIAVVLAVPLLWMSSSTFATNLYVDGNLSRNCRGNYSVSKRDGSGGDGDAYKTIVEAANVAKAGDVVLIRAGVYHNANSVQENDVLWPKNSGTAAQPITFRAYHNEQVVLGEAAPGYPDSEGVVMSIARGVVTLKNVRYIVIEGLSFKKVDGWVFARNCDHLTFRDCIFQDAVHGAKGTARFIECTDNRILHCSFLNSSFDGLTLEKCDRTLIEDCRFRTAAHSLLAIRGSSHSVVRNCQFNNPFFKNRRAEKLVEVYDVKLDRRDPASPVYLSPPAYDATKHNLFENNFFGYHPFRPQSGEQSSAMQYSGQEGIVRRNIFSNPVRAKPDPENPEAIAGGKGFYLRWGGSWDGWKMKKDGTGIWRGQAIEAGYVTHNRIYNNVFYGYDNGCVTTPREDAMRKVLNPPPMNEANPAQQFSLPFSFQDNRFVNNVFLPGPFQAHTNWSWAKQLGGKPVAAVMLGLLNEMAFERNDFYNATSPVLIFLREKAGKFSHGLAVPPTDEALTSGGTFAGSLQVDPQFVDPAKDDFRLKQESPLIDAGAFLTTTGGAKSSSRVMKVQDVEPFFDGFGIEGEKGDVIQLDGQQETARITHIDYAKKELTLDRPLSWNAGQKVALAYSGKGPDVGAFEEGQESDIGPHAIPQPQP